MATDAGTTALPYHEPGIVAILTLASFLLALNVINHILDSIIYCGLLGQILLGILWGTPGGKWLDRSAEKFIVDVGYLGLILLVYEGGLSTSFKSLKANLFLSSGIALTGIALPIALSYVLRPLADASALQAFAAGSALCSTSLGTTFTILGASGLITTRMGVLLAMAAMMDDVVGLVMVQVISNLGTSSSSVGATTIIRPVFVSIAFAIVIPLIAGFVVQPFTHWLNSKRMTKMPQWSKSRLESPKFALLIHTLLLVGLITGSSYAGTSNLFAAYLAGASISWWDSEVEHPSVDSSQSTAPRNHTDREWSSGEAVFARYYQPALQRILKPLFFASIGFSIPITQMFSGTIVWKGIIYTILMIISKVMCGFWLVRVAIPIPQMFRWANTKNKQPLEAEKSKTPRDIQQADLGLNTLISSPDRQSTVSAGVMAQASPDTTEEQARPSKSNTSRRLSSKKSIEHPHHLKSAAKPVSLYPAAIVGSAMTARGEIGFLISSLAESNGIFRREQIASSQTDRPDEIFLIVTWAIVLCTIIGPVAVGFMVRRMNRLENQARAQARDRPNTLGIWN